MWYVDKQKFNSISSREKIEISWNANNISQVPQKACSEIILLIIKSVEKSIWTEWTNIRLNEIILLSKWLINDAKL